MKFTIRERLAIFLVALSRIPIHLIALTLSPNNLISLVKKNYKKPAFEKYNLAWHISRGLFEYEEEQIKNCNFKENREILVIGCGGGRESIPLAKKGLKVTAMDSEPIMIEAAKKYAKKVNVEINFLIKDMYNLDFPSSSFDGIIIFNHLYAQIPGKKRRVNLLKNLNSILRPGGKIIINFPLRKLNNLSKKFFPLSKLIAFLTFGNFGYQFGDVIITPSLGGLPEFLHYFQSTHEIISEAEVGGLREYQVELGNRLTCCTFIWKNYIILTSQDK